MFFVEFFFRGRGEVNIYYRGLSLSSLIPLSRGRERRERKRERERMKNPWKKEEKRKGNVENRYGGGNKIFHCSSSIAGNFVEIPTGRDRKKSVRPIIAFIMKV